MPWLRSRIFQRFVSTMLALSLAPCVFLGWKLLAISRAGIEDAVLELHTKFASKSAELVSAYLRGLNEKLLFTKAALLQPGLDWERRQNLLKSLIESHPDIEQVSILRNEREVIKVFNPALSAAEQRRVSYAEDPGYRSFAERRARTFWIERRAGGTPRIQIYDALSPISSLRISVVLDELKRVISAERIGGSGYPMLVGPGGAPLIYPEELVTAQELAAIANSPTISRALAASGVGSSESRSARGLRQIVAFAPVPEISAAVVTQQPADEAYQAALRMKRTALLVMLAVCVLVVLTALLLARRLTVPLIDLTEGARRVAHGEFPRVAPIETGDELQHFAETFNTMVGRLQDREELRRKFGQFMSEEIARLIEDGRVNLGGEEIRATVLFCDLHDFTPMSEKMRPNEVVEFLNSYFGYITKMIGENRGVINKFIGDAVLAIYAQKLGSSKHETDAVRTALAMRKALEEFNRTTTLGHKARFGIGIQTGTLVAGNVGTQTRMEYTVVGDTVNVASRLAAATKDSGVDLLLTEDVYRRAKDALSGGRFREIGPMALKGRSERMLVYTVEAG